MIPFRIFLYIILLSLTNLFILYKAAIIDNDYLLMKNERVCNSIDIRKKSHLRQLDNCTVIEGHLYISLLRLSPSPKSNYPLLKEITESLLIYHVKGIKNLGLYFPNLSLIRGQSLTYNYALVITDTSLMNVGLTNLRVILAGGVRIDTNPLLCYISSVNWPAIVKQKGAPIKVINSKNICPDFCPKNCVKNTHKTMGYVGQCWSQRECQNVCSAECTNHGLTCAMHETTKCCHHECLGGCYGPSNDQCVSCKSVMFKGQCVNSCQQGYYKLKGRRCISEQECFSKMYYSTSNSSDKELFAIEGESCVKKCSHGKERDKLTGKCTDCGQDCKTKNCEDILIHSISDLKQVEGCYSVKELYINIKEGEKILSRSLEEYFSKLTVIEGSIRIIQSLSITSLDFLKSLRVIKGTSFQNKQQNDNKSIDNNVPVVFEVYGNENLVHVWGNKMNENQSFINILYGSISFKLNRKLCPDKIMKFLHHNIASPYKLSTLDLRIINVSNGDMAYCNEDRLLIELIAVTNSSVTVICNSKNINSKIQDHSPSALFMIKQTNLDLSPFVLFNNCNDQGLRIIEGTLGKAEYIGNLSPATRYVIYVEVIRYRVDNWLEISDYLYFTTNITYPSPPLRFNAEGISDTEIKLTWSPPLFPNGIISKYFISYQKLDIPEEDFIYNESCSDTSYVNMAKLRPSLPTTDYNTPMNNSNFICNCGNCLTLCTENQQRIDRISNDFGSQMIAQYSEVLLQPQIRDHDHNLFPIDGIGYIGGRNKNANMVEYLNHHQNFRNLSLLYSNIQMIHSLHVSADNNSLLVKDLHYYSEYLFEIQACQELSRDHGSSQPDDYLCSDRASINGFTFSKKDADNINESSVEISYSRQSVIVTWIEPANPNGLILYFIIRYREVPSEIMLWHEKCVSRWEWSTKEKITKNDTREQASNTTDQPLHREMVHDRTFPLKGSVELSNLRLGTYVFQIKSVSIAGYSSWSKNREFQIISNSIAESYKEVFIIGFIFTPIFIALAVWIIYHYYRKKFLAKKKWISSNPDYWIIYEIDEWEIKREDVDMIGWNYALGRGSFGLVYKGTLKNLTTPANLRFSDQSNLKNIFVAVKTLNSSSTICERREFINEACYMKQFQSHHLVMLFGIVSKVDHSQMNSNSYKNKKFFGRIVILQTAHQRLAQAWSTILYRCNLRKPRECTSVVCDELEILKRTIQQHFQKMPLVVMELMENGDLAGYLRKQGEDGDGLVSENQACLWALQIADGMLYLSDRKFVHRDLATRNCMVNADVIVKIGDFGMARDVYYDCYYRKKGTGRLPVRWMAPEALRSAYFTVASDVWSYGVVIWEIVTLASMPFRGMSHCDVIQFVTNGGNLLTNSAPLSCSKILLNLMQTCWQIEPLQRPTFQNIVSSLETFSDDTFNNNSYYFEKELQSTISLEDYSTDVVSNYSKGNVIDNSDEIS